ncbi:MAG: hypothetical protein WDN75_19080 [Bacteroidota bacterium]
MRNERLCPLIGRQHPIFTKRLHDCQKTAGIASVDKEPGILSCIVISQRGITHIADVMSIVPGPE